jgi:hypothetical protein
MHAKVGEWLVVSGHTDGRHERRAEIVAIASPNGEPPYTVRWLDTGRTAIVFPGPDAAVLSAARQAELDRAAVERVQRVRLPSPPARRAIPGRTESGVSAGDGHRPGRRL